MNELLDKFNAGQLIGLVSVLGAVLVAITAVVTFQWRRVRVAELEAALKQNMLDKCMSASDIAHVINAGKELDSDSQVGATGDAAVDRAAVVQNMIENGYEGEDIERVLRAYQVPEKPVQEVVAR